MRTLLLAILFAVTIALALVNWNEHGIAADPLPVPVPPVGQARPMNGPVLGQWQIYRVEVSSGAGNKAPDQKNAFYTVLLDSATGENWLLSPKNKDGSPPFVWVRIEREPKQ
jgi:hypothetical protein